MKYITTTLLLLSCITTFANKNNVNNKFCGDSIPKMISRIEAEFPEGKAEWINYLNNNINIKVPFNNNAPIGKYSLIVNFSINEEGEVKNVLAESNPGYGTKEEAERLISKSPKWIPASLNGKKVESTYKQEIYFNVAEEKIISQVPSEFPGGQINWLDYIMSNTNNDIPVNRGAPAGNYFVKVSFVIDREGNIVDVKAENNPGYGMKEEAERVIRNAPKWIPATQNGKPVIYRHKQSIGFLIREN